MKKSTILKSVLFLFLLQTNVNAIYAQCCAGGSGSPIAGGTSQGVLQERQVELNTNFQFIDTDEFYKEDAKDTTRTFDSFSSVYQYFRLAYGVTKNLTMSVESGYFFSKKEVGLNGDAASSYESKGIADLVIFPRYDVINWTDEKTRTELTLGLGYKIPLGSYNDSIGNIEPFSGDTYYVTKPLSVQLSSGAQDLIFYSFFYRDYTEKNFRVFANAMYIKKGWNPNGEKLGDFASVGLFAGKTFFKNLGLTLQMRYEWVDSMQINESVLLFGKPSNYFPGATGYKKLFFSPQIGYTKGKVTFYASYDIPLYQYLNTADYYTQVGSKTQATVGMSYRFFARRSIVPNSASGTYYCPMDPEVVSDKAGICPKCNMNLRIKK
jgi:hypothetical protein